MWVQVGDGVLAETSLDLPGAPILQTWGYEWREGLWRGSMDRTTTLPSGIVCMHSIGHCGSVPVVAIALDVSHATLFQ